MDNTDGDGGHEHDLDDLEPMDYEARVRLTDFGKRHLPADIARSLGLGRHHRGWSLRTAERRLGVSFGYLCHLESGNRVPSSVVAELLIDRY
ncbi:MAG TPA: helix-turn-helix transcriptional regulator, partial [Acidimicrobiales bacterium]|nr:helix-turn-helix transcriptional regulator [Acidimicrobiales bacterium]